MWNSTPIDGSHGMKTRRALSTIAAICLAATAGCSQAGEAPKRTEDASPTSLVSTAGSPAEDTVAVERRAVPATGNEAGSRVLGEKDFTLRGVPACEVRFAYAGRDAETLFWEEPCAAVTAKMVTRPELEALGKWGRLDGFARKFVDALPGGKVLYVEGGVSASVYPVGTNGSTYEVPVAD